MKQVASLRRTNRHTMDEHFQCPVCLEMCRECVNCTKCNQILCKTHVSSCNDTCPFCRASPFHVQDNVALQRIIADIKRRSGNTTPPPPAPPPAPNLRSTVQVARASHQNRTEAEWRRRRRASAQVYDQDSDSASDS